MAADWEALRLVLLFIGWPGLVGVSTYAVMRAAAFYKGLRHSAPGLLVFLMILGWVATLVGTAMLATMFLLADPEGAGPIVMPVFVVWAGSMITIVWVVQKWGQEASVLDTYYGHVERMEKMKSGFINHVAHELNTPMTPLRMQVSVLKKEIKGPLNADQKTVVERMERNLDRLSLLVDQVLMASRIQSDTLHFQVNEEALDVIVREAADAVSKDIKVEGEAMARVDRDRFGYAIQTLLAELAQRQGSQDLVVRIEQRGGDIVVGVAHNGAPLTAKHFQAFTDPEAAQDRDGIAIGLFNVQGIIDRHDGRIESARDGTVEVVLPTGGRLSWSPNARLA